MKQNPSVRKWQRARAVACPRCLAEPGQPCKYMFFEPPKGSDHLRNSHHLSRYEAAAAIKEVKEAQV